MSLDDLLNGGIDRDFDGDIDNIDREIMLSEDDFAEKQEWYETTYAYDYGDEFDDDYGVEFDDDYGDEYDYDDVIKSYSSYQNSATVSAPTEKKTMAVATPVYNSQKKEKDDKVVIEWENMPAETAKEAKNACRVYFLFLCIFLFGVVIIFLIPTFSYKDVDLIVPFLISGLIIALIGFILMCSYSNESFDLIQYYTHVEDKNGRIKYISKFEANKISASKSDFPENKK